MLLQDFKMYKQGEIATCRLKAQDCTGAPGPNYTDLNLSNLRSGALKHPEIPDCLVLLLARLLIFLARCHQDKRFQILGFLFYNDISHLL